MDALNIILLGLLQGLTEFLPVSSSGHLTLLQHILDLSKSSYKIELVLHVGTSFAVLIYFRDDIINMFTSKKGLDFLLKIALAVCATGILGYPLKNHILNLFLQPDKVAIFLCCNGIMLLASGFLPNNKEGSLTYKIALMIGLIQLLGLIPGISRSGVTIMFGVLLGLSYHQALKFSFFLSLPSVWGAIFLSLPEFSYAGELNYLTLSVGLVAAFFSGILAIFVLDKIIPKKNIKFTCFGIYCVLIAGLFLVIF